MNIDRFKWFPKLTVALKLFKKLTYMHLIGSKAVLYLCFSSNFLFNVVIIRHFITVKTLDILESRCLRT